MQTQPGVSSAMPEIKTHAEQQQEQHSTASVPTMFTWSSESQAQSGPGIRTQQGIFSSASVPTAPHTVNMAMNCQAPQIGLDFLLQLTRQRQGLSSAISANESNMHQQLLLPQLQLSVAPAPNVLLQLMKQRQASSNIMSVTESNSQQLLTQLTVAHSLNASPSNSSPFSYDMMLQGIGGHYLLLMLLLRVQAQQGLASAAPATASNSSSFSHEHILHGLSRDRGFFQNIMQHIHSQQGLSSIALATESEMYLQRQRHQQHQDLPLIGSRVTNVCNLMSSPRQSQSAPFIPGDREGTSAAALTPPSLRSCGIAMGLPDDSRRLSEYQIAIRQHLEIFEAKQEDVRSNVQGRKRRLFLGQVGIRCRHCSNLRLRERGRAAVYYPLKLSGIYQAAQHMARSHLSDSCSQIHPGIKQRFRDLRLRRETASGGKEYWAEAGRAIGLYETEDGLRLYPGAAP
jgi:hypothetical protein